MPKPLREPPVSIRFSKSEREALTRRAGLNSLSGYVKSVLFMDRPVSDRTAGTTLADRAILARLLAVMGASSIGPNLARLAEAADTGTLFVDDHVTTQLHEACDDVRLMHNALMRGLGKQERAASRREQRAREAFNNAANEECH
jgi:hypothetical protein